MKATLANLEFRDISVKGEKGEALATVLFDTGASFSFVSEKFAAQVGKAMDADRPMEISVADGRKIKIDKMVFLTVTLGARAITDNFYVMPGALTDVILGMTTLRKYQIRIEAGQDAVFAELIETKKETSMWKKFLAAIGITVAEDVTEEKAVELVKEKISKPAQTQLAASKGILAVLELKETATEDEVKGKILALKNPGDTVPLAKYQDLEAKVKESELQAAVLGALSIGKVTPAEKESWLKDLKEGKETLATFNAFVAHRGKIVPIGDKLPEKKEDKAAEGITETDLAVMKQLGLSKETFLKYNAAG